MTSERAKSDPLSTDLALLLFFFRSVLSYEGD